MTNRARVALLRRAIRASGLTPAAFAEDVLDVTTRAVDYWLSGERPIQGPTAQLCRAIVANPAITLAAVMPPTPEGKP